MKRIVGSIVLLVSVMFLLVENVTGQTYQVIDIGASLNSSSEAYGINNSGQIVGSSRDGAFLYSNGSVVDLGPGTARGINESGQVVGYSSDNHAFIYSDGVMLDLGTFGGSSSFAFGTNDLGQVVGFYDSYYAASYHPFLYTDGSMKDLAPYLSGIAIALAINNLGQVPIFHDGHTLLSLNGSMLDLGSSGIPWGINESGQVANEPFYGINESGQRVGGSSLSYPDGTTVDLNSLIDPASGWILTEARAINDLGQIVGWGISPSGQQHAFLLTQIPESTTPSIFFSLGLIVLIFLRRIRKSK